MSNPVNVSELIGDIKPYAYNPAGMQRVAMAAYKAIHNGEIEIVDATNPFVSLIEISSVNTSAMMQHAAALTRRQYPASATTFEELYLHMSNTDYANIFALPSEVMFYLAINKAQLLNALVLDVDTGISKVTIPRNTVFYASGIPFSLQYPVDIRKLEHGDLQIVYDASQPTVLQNLTTNVIEDETIRGADGEEYIQFGVETQQFIISSITNPFDSTSGFALSVPFENQYYGARVYVSNSDSTWREIQVTYTDQVYDPLVPTAALQVVGNKLNVRLPLVYITTNLVSGKMRVDVYQTQGPMDLQLGNYAPDNFIVEFIHIDENDTSPYITALKSIPNIAPFAKDKTSGGRNALTFAELQARVIQNSIGPPKLPITPSQIQATNLDKGYTLVKHVDTLTDRIYWATKALPAPNSPTLVTPANANVATIVTQVGSAETLQGCYRHITGMTIGSKALVQNNNGITSLVTKAGYAGLMALPLADRTSALNSSRYSYTPFHYVLDNTTDSFMVRPYYLDDPKIYSRSFVQENPDTGLQASIGTTFGVEKTDAGYRLTIATKSNDAYKALADNEVFCQLAFSSDSQVATAYMLGAQVTRQHETDERVFVFDITSVYDVDSNHALAVPSFQTNTAGFIPRCTLKQTFSVLFGTSNAEAVQTPTTDIDTRLGTFQFNAASIGITHEHLTLTFGYALDTLWNSFRSFTNAIPFQTYTSDVPKYYDEDVFGHDPVTGATISIVNGAPVYNIQHHAGDPVLDGNGQQVYLHRVGEPILDVFNRPKPVENYQTVLSRSVDLMTLDGVYQFANDPVTLDYVQQIKSSLLTSLTQDLVNLNAKALEKTEIYYYPAITQGNVNALADNNQLINIEAAQTLKVSLYVDELVFNNKTLTAALQSATIKAIGAFLAANSTVAVSALEDKLAEVYGSDVLSVNVAGLGGANNYRVITVTDDSTKLSIRKVLKLLPSGQLAVQEDISVTFTTHGFGTA
jgi:hypothetical protein